MSRCYHPDLHRAEVERFPPAVVGHSTEVASLGLATGAVDISPRDPRIVGMTDPIGRGSDDELRFLDSDFPASHSFRAGIVLPDSCIVCGDTINAPWHRGQA